MPDGVRALTDDGDGEFSCLNHTVHMHSRFIIIMQFVAIQYVVSFPIQYERCHTYVCTYIDSVDEDMREEEEEAAASVVCGSSLTPPAHL